MKILYHHRGKDYLLSASTDKPPCPALDVYGDGKKYFVPLVDPDDVQASDIRVNVGGQTLAPLLAYEDAVDICTNRTLADVRNIFNSGLGKYYFKVGDFFNVTFPSRITLNSGNIAANSTWRAVLIGIDHNPSLEGYNRGHFSICKSSAGKNICFYGKRMNSTNTSDGGWASCEMRSFLNGTFYNALPTDLRNVISTCTKYTNNTGGSSANTATATQDNIWLLGNNEFQSATNYYAVADEKNKQKIYEYFTAGNSWIHYRHAAQSTAQNWYTRSFTTHATYADIIIGSSGTRGNGTCHVSRGFMPCFTIGGDS